MRRLVVGETVAANLALTEELVMHAIGSSKVMIPEGATGTVERLSSVGLVDVKFSYGSHVQQLWVPDHLVTVVEND